MDNKKIYFAVKALIINKGKALILHKVNESNEVWELPGGRMEFVETAEETLLREVMEETGLNVYPIKLLDTWNYMGQDYQITGVIYLCKSEDKNIKLSNEHDNYKWVDINNKITDNIHQVFKVRMKEWNWNEVNKIIKNIYPNRVYSFIWT